MTFTVLLSDLNIKVHQFNLVQQVIDLPGLQPAIRLLLPAAQVNENTQTALGVVESCPVCPENIQKLSPVAPNLKLKLKLIVNIFKLTADMIPFPKCEFLFPY